MILIFAINGFCISSIFGVHPFFCRQITVFEFRLQWFLQKNFSSAWIIFLWQTRFHIEEVFLDDQFVQCINVNILLRHYFKYLGIEATVIYGSLLNRSKVLTMKTIFVAEICETVFALLSACPMSSLKWLAESQTTPTSGLMRRRTTKIMGNGFTISSPSSACQLTAKCHRAKQVRKQHERLHYR